MDTLEQIEAMVAQEFYEIWNFDGCWAYTYADAKDGAFELCNEIRRELDWPEYDRATFEDGFQYRNIFAGYYAEAVNEMVNLVVGWW